MIKKVNDRIDKLSSLKQSIGEKIIKNQMFLLWNKNSLRERYGEL
jgi:regulator of replication initiation timing